MAQKCAILFSLKHLDFYQFHRRIELKTLKGKKKFLNFFDVHLTGAGGFLLRSLIHGFVLKVLWLWFVTGTFHFVPALTLSQGAGIYLLFAFVKHDYRVKRNHNHLEIEAEEEGATRGRKLITLYKEMILRAAAALVAGAVLHYFLNFI